MSIDRLLLEPLDVSAPWQEFDPQRDAGRKAHDRICSLSATAEEIAEIAALERADNTRSAT